MNGNFVFYLAAPANGAVDIEPTGIDNPGVYENLPFHGLQQAPNKVCDPCLQNLY